MLHSLPKNSPYPLYSFASDYLSSGVDERRFHRKLLHMGSDLPHRGHQGRSYWNHQATIALWTNFLGSKRSALRSPNEKKLRSFLDFLDSRLSTSDAQEAAYALAWTFMQLRKKFPESIVEDYIIPAKPSRSFYSWENNLRAARK